MSLFSSRDPKPSSAPPAPVRAPQPSRVASTQGGPETTLIASGSRVVGEISGSAELVIDGEVEGHIDLDSLVVVGPKGYVEGEIQARSVRVGGKVIGNIRGRERVEVQDSGRLEGDVEAPAVVISEGAFFKGKIEMTGDRGAKAGERPTKEKKSTPPHGGAAPPVGAPAASVGGGPSPSEELQAAKKTESSDK